MCSGPAKLIDPELCQKANYLNILRQDARNQISIKKRNFTDRQDSQLVSSETFQKTIKNNKHRGIYFPLCFKINRNRY